MKKFLLVFITFVPILISLSACFSHYQGEGAELIISVSGASRAAGDVVYNANDTETHGRLNYEVTLSRGKETLYFKFDAGEAMEIIVSPGKWNVKVDSYLNKDIYGTTDTEEIELKLGQNHKTIDMYQAFMITFDANGGSGTIKPLIIKAGDSVTPPTVSRTGYAFDGWNTKADGSGGNYPVGSDYVTDKQSKGITLYAKWIAITVPGNSLAEKLNWLYGNVVNGGNYLVTVNKDESINSGNTLGYGGKKVNITLTGGGKVSLNDVVHGNIFLIEQNVTLVLEKITLEGRKDNRSPLVYVSGKLIMNDGAVITGNTVNGDWGGGGVTVTSEDGSAYFLMNGGTISNNVSYWGGGVNIWNGTFEMRGGNITGNKVIVNNEGNGECGGGVLIDENGNFIMTGGNIYNNNGDDGGGVCVNGIFDMSAGEIYDNKATRGSGVSVGVGGTFNMIGGEIYNNNNNTSNPEKQWYGGGVHVNGTFNMSAGKIHDNTAPGGGGVNMHLGTFNMTGGEIYKNTVNQLGGGVNVQEDGKFTKSGGTIYGYSDNPNNGNVVKDASGVVQSDHGHAVCVGTGGNILYHRETTAGSSVNMSYNGTPGSGSGF